MLELCGDWLWLYFLLILFFKNFLIIVVKYLELGLDFFLFLFFIFLSGLIVDFMFCFLLRSFILRFFVWLDLVKCLIVCKFVGWWFFFDGDICICDCKVFNFWFFMFFVKVKVLEFVFLVFDIGFKGFMVMSFGIFVVLEIFWKFLLLNFMNFWFFLWEKYNYCYWIFLLIIFKIG